MKNFIQAGEILAVAAPATTASGDYVVVGAIRGVAMTDAASGATVQVMTEGVFELPKATSLVMSVGDKLYWDVADGNFNKSPSGNVLAGVCVVAAASNDTTVKVYISLEMAAAETGTQGAAVADLTGTLTGTANGALVDVAATAGACAGGSSPTASNVDTAIATAVASIVTGVNEQNKEFETKINALLAELRVAGVIASS